MSRISEVLKNKNIVEKSQRARRKEELTTLKGKSAYKASLSEEMKHIDILLSSMEIDGVIIKIPDRLISRFSESIYSEEMSGYDITQVDGQPDQFEIRFKLI